ncbi:MAG: hypothetical protein LAT64_03350 [Phycisphaerales bacterium]|nr:hypothetical protein [Planctomycetota bacterium]MCH8507791.1 hypothetical protein [Phycisphaerales bacterium]
MTAPMPTINLLPLARRVRRARHRVIAGWFTAGVLVAIGAMAPAGAMALATGSGAAEIEDRTRRAERSIEQLQAEEPRLRRRIADLQQTDRVLKAVEDRADWRPLLHALSAASNGARFERIESRITSEGRTEVRTQIIALVDSLTEARAFVLRLEESGVFDSVTLTNSSRVQLTNAEVVRCEIDARFRLRSTP